MKSCKDCEFLGYTQSQKAFAEKKKVNLEWVKSGYCRNLFKQGWVSKSDYCDNFAKSS